MLLGDLSAPISQQWASWHDLGNNLRRARKLISGPCPSTRIKLLSFNRNQFRVVTGLLTGHNTLRRHLCLLGLLDSPLCRKCGVKVKTSAHILCECEALGALRHRYLGSFFLEPEDVKSISLGAIWSFSRATGSLDFVMGHKGPVNKAQVRQGCEVPHPTSINQSIDQPPFQVH